MSWLDVVLPFTWWQRGLIVLAVLTFSPLLLAAARLAVAVAGLGVGAARIAVRRRRGLRRLRRYGYAVQGWPSLEDSLRQYADDLASGRRMAPLEYLRRCNALRRRGLSADLVDNLRACDSPQLLRLLEGLTDSQISDFNRTAKRRSSR